jgi:hypothetical protein
VAVSGLLALGALQPLAAQAATLPHISATVAGRTTIQVSGYGFGPGTRVEVVDSVGGKAFTRATPLIFVPNVPKCLPTKPCILPLPGGLIHATLPPYVVKCVFRLVSVRADDLTNHTQSNVVRVPLGFGLC